MSSAQTPNQDVSNYFPIATDDLVVGRAIAFNLFVYLPQNQKMIPWKSHGEELTSELLDRCRAKGLLQLWVLKSERDSYEHYRSEESAKKSPAPPAPEVASKVATPPPVTAEGGRIRAALADPALPEPAKAEVVAKEAQAVLEAVAASADAAAQEQAEQHARKILQDVLAETLGKAGSLASELWKSAEIDAELDHGVNVATYGALFAMAFGKIETSLLADIALAGMLHDIGLTQLTVTEAALPLNSPSQRYSTHVTDSLRLIDQFGTDVPARVRTLVEQHHEKFDGTGYPAKLKGFRFNDIAQLLALADVMDSFVSGRWDGTGRTMKEALQTLEKLEKSRTFPEFFNPEVFAAVIRWTRATVEDSTSDTAARIAAEQTLRLGMGKGKKDGGDQAA